MKSYCTVKEALEAENRGEKDYGLCLNDNELTSLPDSIGELKNLQSLDLWRNPSLDWDVAFKLLQKLPNLQKLYLRENQLKSFPASIGELKNLQMLYLSWNQLTSEGKERIKKLLPNTEIIL